MTEEIRDFWDRRAREDAYFFVDSRLRYGDPDLERFWHGGEEALARMTADLGLEIDREDVVVDIGCGLGRVTRAMAPRAARVIAIDISAEMLARARELNSDLDNVEWLCGDGVSLQGIADGEASCCISVVVFQHLPEPRMTYAYVNEIGRVLRRGGWASIQVSDDPALHRGRGRSSLIRATLPRLLGRAPRGLGDPAWRGSAVDLAELAEAARSAGLKIEAVSGEGTQFCLVALRKQ